MLIPGLCILAARSHPLTELRELVRLRAGAEGRRARNSIRRLGAVPHRYGLEQSSVALWNDGIWIVFKILFVVFESSSATQTTVNTNTESVL